MSMELSKVAKQVGGSWSNFFSRQVINVAVSIALACITISLMKVFHIELQETVWNVLLFQTIVFLAFLSVTQMFMSLFGNAGMLFNIISLSLQLVSSGVMVPRAMLSQTYQTIGGLFPATYAANGYYTIIFGGGNISSDLIHLLIIIGITQVLAIIGNVLSNSLQKNRGIMRVKDA